MLVQLLLISQVSVTLRRRKKSSESQIMMIVSQLLSQINQDHLHLTSQVQESSMSQSQHLSQLLNHSLSQLSHRIKVDH